MPFLMSLSVIPFLDAFRRLYEPLSVRPSVGCAFFFILTAEIELNEHKKYWKSEEMDPLLQNNLLTTCNEPAIYL